MIHIIEATDGKRRWISGIFKNTRDAERYLNEIPADLKPFQQLLSIDLEYPFYVVETSGFEYLGLDVLIEKLDSIECFENGEEVYLIVYAIKGDYSAKKAGTDYMGSINHDHVTADFMKWYKKQGMDFLRIRGLV
ncbi:hypothetical protein AB4Z22_18545 [Paenibacillus sp. TAF58]